MVMNIKPLFLNMKMIIKKRIEDLISRLTLEEKISQLVHENETIDRLGIPEYNWWSECLHGVGRAGKATVFPQAIALAATFNTGLIFKIASAISDEARARYNLAYKKNRQKRYMGLTCFSPNINIFRDPRWGRGQETYGEDPFLTSQIAINFVKGLQGNDKRYLKIAACAKHFAVHSGPEKLRRNFDAEVSQKDLNETYLPAFKALVDANVEGFMPAYNKINGIPCAVNRELLIDLLRNQWGFKGYITTDGWALNDLHGEQGYTKSPEETSVLAIKNGCDLELGSNHYLTLAQSVKKDKIDEKSIDDALYNLLQTKFRLGLFDNHKSVPYSKIKPSVINCRKHKKLAKQAALESVVLLKNKDSILPLKKDINSMAVVGPHALNCEILLGNYHGLNDRLTTILEAITGKIDKTTSIYYNHSILAGRSNPNPVDWSLIEIRKADIAIAVLGYNPLLEGEEGDAIESEHIGDRASIGLPQHQEEYLRKVTETGTPVILILTGGWPISIPQEIMDKTDAILAVWYPGEMGGEAVADILFGDAVPSGRLPFTVPCSIADLPDFTDYSMENRTYKYIKSKPLFPFGFGLSYTKFKYGKLKLSKDQMLENEKITARFNLTNTGNYAGFETVQMYISCLCADFRVPNFELKTFRKVFLKPGKSESIEFVIDPAMLRVIDNEGKSVLLKGEYKITIGGVSPGDWDKSLGTANLIVGNLKLV